MDQTQILYQNDDYYIKTLDSIEEFKVIVDEFLLDCFVNDRSTIAHIFGVESDRFLKKWQLDIQHLIELKCSVVVVDKKSSKPVGFFGAKDYTFHSDPLLN